MKQSSIVRKAVSVAAGLVEVSEETVLSPDRHTRVFYAKVVLSQYLVGILGLSHRRAARLLGCARSALESRLHFFDRTRKYAWKYEKFDGLYRRFLDGMNGGSAHD